MNAIVALLCKSKLVAGVATTVLRVVVLASPGPSILVAATLFRVYLLISRVADMFIAFKLPSSVATRVLLFISGALSFVLAILAFPRLGYSYCRALAVVVDPNCIRLPACFRYRRANQRS